MEAPFRRERDQQGERHLRRIGLFFASLALLNLPRSQPSATTLWIPLRSDRAPLSWPQKIAICSTPFAATPPWYRLRPNTMKSAIRNGSGETPAPSETSRPEPHRTASEPSTAQTVGKRGQVVSLVVVSSDVDDERAIPTASREKPMKPSKKALPAVFAGKAFRVETTGIEPATSGLQSQRSPS